MFVISLIQIVQGRGKVVVSNAPLYPLANVDLEEMHAPSIYDHPPPLDEV